MSLNRTYFETKGRDISTPIPDTPSYVPPSPPTPPSPDPGNVPSITPPSFTGSTSIELYVNSSERNRVDKALTSVYTGSVVLKDNVDILNPEIKEFTTNANLPDCNYMKLGDRYYYAHVQMLPGGNRYKIVGETDPLMTFKDEIRNQTGLIRRNQNFYNRYLNDERVKLNAYEQVKTLMFPSGFSKTMQYYLVTIGGAE